MSQGSFAQGRGAGPSAPGALHSILSEEEFVPLLRVAIQGLFRLHNVLVRMPQAEWGKRHFNRLFQEAEELESFLDDFGARHNRTYYVLREMVAAIRGFAAACHVLKHLDLRLGNYALRATAEEQGSFQRDLVRTQGFACLTAERLLVEVTREAERLGVARTSEALADDKIGVEIVARRLPHTLGVKQQAEGDADRLEELASAFAAAARRFQAIPDGPFAAGVEMRRFLDEHLHEEDARTLEAMVHNLQSQYDTYLWNTSEERRLPLLPSLRGHASVALHLLEFTVLLVHFYERHEKEAAGDGDHSWLSKIVDGDTVLDHAVHFGLGWARTFMLRGIAVVDEIRDKYLSLQCVELTLPEGSVLHARPASLIVNIVNHHGKPVEMEMDGESVNAGSIMKVMILAGTKAGTDRVVFRGDAAPLADLRVLFASGLGENGLEGLPEQLAYLKQ